MKVEIDGIEYVPHKPLLADANEKDKALAATMLHCNDFENITVKDYLCKLLTTIWKEGGSFSGTRPFGNSGWKLDLIYSLVQIGYIPGKLKIDAEGWAGDCDYDEKQANRLIEELIGYCFNHE